MRDTIDAQTQILHVMYISPHKPGAKAPTRQMSSLCHHQLCSTQSKRRYTKQSLQTSATQINLPQSNNINFEPDLTINGMYQEDILKLTREQDLHKIKSLEVIYQDSLYRHTILNQNALADDLLRSMPNLKIIKLTQCQAHINTQAWSITRILNHQDHPIKQVILDKTMVSKKVHTELNKESSTIKVEKKGNHIIITSLIEK